MLLKDGVVLVAFGMVCLDFGCPRSLLKIEAGLCFHLFTKYRHDRSVGGVYRAPVSKPDPCDSLPNILILK